MIIMLTYECIEKYGLRTTRVCGREVSEIRETDILEVLQALRDMYGDVVINSVLGSGRL